MTSPLPFQPETIESIRARFPSAIQDVYDTATMAFTGRPGQYRTHVFDFEDGIRMIASRDRAMGRTYLHFSFSLETTGQPARTLSWFENRAEKLAQKFSNGAKLKARAGTKYAIHFMYDSQ